MLAMMYAMPSVSRLPKHRLTRDVIRIAPSSSAAPACGMGGCCVVKSDRRGIELTGYVAHVRRCCAPEREDVLSYSVLCVIGMHNLTDGSIRIAFDL